MPTQIVEDGSIIKERPAFPRKRAVRDAEDDKLASKRRKSESDQDEYALAAAFLRCDGISQKEIGDRLDASQPDVSRLLDRARANGWLEEISRFHVPREHIERWEKVKARFFSGRELHELLLRRFPDTEDCLKHVTLVHSDPRSHQFGPSVVTFVTGLLAGVSWCGITWGRTINRVAALLEEALEGDHPKRSTPIHFVPLCGEPVSYKGDPVEFSSSRLSARLDRAFNGTDRSQQMPSLYGVPASISLKFENGFDFIKSYVSDMQGYSEIFGGSDRRTSLSPLVERLDAILTSVGVSNESDRGVFLEERIQAGDISATQAERLIAGDVGGMIIPREKITDKQRDLVDRLNSHWNGVKIDHLRRCVASASATRPGVVVFAIGAHRRDVVLQCVKMRLVNHLVVDQEFFNAALAAV